MNSLCNVGLCFNPSLNRTRSVRAALRSQARRAQHRQARALTLPLLRRLPSVSLVPIHRKRQTHSPNGFSSRVCFAKRFTPFQGKAPLRPAFPSAGRFAPRPHPFAPKLSRFRACSFVAAETAPAPCSNNQVGGGGLTPEPSPTKTGARSGPATRGGKPRLPVQPNAVIVRTLPMVFSGPASSVQPQQPFPRRRV
jgi:hypothetical protein